MSEPETTGDHAHARPRSIKRTVRRGWYVLLLVQFAALVYPGWYSHESPHLGPWPFFYWYQFLWVLLGALLNYVVLRLTTEERR